MKPATDRPLKMLIVEDSEDDALLLARNLRDEGYLPEYERVDTAESLLSALQAQRWDIVVTDHNMPQFSATDALSITREVAPDLPVIIVSGLIGEELAVEAMRAGANDYIMKDNLARLAPAIDRELANAKVLQAQRKAEKAIEHMAYHDSLTGLVNRHEFERRLERILNSTAADNSEHALCYLDLDQFKVINDTCGHIAGDELLRQISRVLSKQVRQRDTLARLGGDEFGALMEHCSLEQAQRIAISLCRVVEDFQFVWEGKLFRIGVSIGVVPITGGKETITSLLSAADSACYQAKEKGRNRVHVYYEDDKEMVNRLGEMQWVSRIHRALEAGRFQLVSQPIQPLGDRESVGSHFEILIRMQNEDGGLVLPGVFLPAAERYNLSAQIDRWVVKNTLDWLNGPTVDLDGLYLCSVNLSAQSLSADGFLEFITETFDRTNIPPERICFEITETAAITNLPNAMKFIQSLKDLGCQFALDDFGSGLCSFAYLRNLPIDFLKIDGVFVKDMVNNSIDHAMVKSINDIGQVMGKYTIAEFVETDSILSALEEIGVDFGQGSVIGKPQLIDTSTH